MKENSIKPRVSVILSVFNGACFLKDSIQSILDQSFNQFEFIIINDGSTDESLEIIKKFKDDRIRLINQKNIGLTKSLNKGIKLSNCEYIARIDSDEYSMKERLSKQVEVLDSHKEIGIVGTFSEDHNLLSTNKSKIVKVPIEDSAIRKSMITINPFIHGSVMVRKSIITEVGGYNENFKYVQDYELWGRIANLCRLKNIPEVLLKRINDKNSITYNSSVMKQRGLFALKAQLSVIKNQRLPFYYYLLSYKRVLIFLLYLLKVIRNPIQYKEDLL